MKRFATERYGEEWARNREIEHYDKYLDYAKKLGVSFDESADLPRFIEEIKAGNKAFNSMPDYPLRRWDVFHAYYAINGRKLNPCWALSESVCVAKVAALRSALKAIFPTMPMDSGKDMSAALDYLYSGNPYDSD